MTTDNPCAVSMAPLRRRDRLIYALAVSEAGADPDELDALLSSRTRTHLDVPSLIADGTVRVAVLEKLGEKLAEYAERFNIPRLNIIAYGIAVGLTAHARPVTPTAGYHPHDDYGSWLLDLRRAPDPVTDAIITAVHDACWHMPAGSVDRILNAGFERGACWLSLDSVDTLVPVDWWTDFTNALLKQGQPSLAGRVNVLLEALYAPLGRRS